MSCHVHLELNNNNDHYCESKTVPSDRTPDRLRADGWLDMKGQKVLSRRTLRVHDAQVRHHMKLPTFHAF